MATIYDNNLSIQSVFGFKRPAYSIECPLPTITETTKHLWEDVERPDTPATVGTRILRTTAPVDPFIFAPGTTSTMEFVSNGDVIPGLLDTLKWYTTGSTQTVVLTNLGNTPINVTDVLQNPPQTRGVIAVYHSTTTFVINPGAEVPLVLAYYGSTIGEFASYINIISDFSSGNFKIPTRQIVRRTTDFRFSPTSISTTTIHYGQDTLVSYDIIPMINGIDRPDVAFPVSGSISGSSAWTIKGTGTNSISLLFSPNEVNNVNGTYISTLTVYANAATHSATNTGIINIDYTKNKNLSSWLSPIAPDNSVIGISYDLEDDKRYLTIGVGMGGDGTPIYSEGGYSYLDVDNLGLCAAHLDQPFPFWAEVYRIECTGAAQVYHSEDYRIKSTSGLNYGYYFGEYRAPGSMFIIADDGYGSLTIEINHLREHSADDTFNTTLDHLTRSFYYYSSIDSRYVPQAAEYAAPIDAYTTQMFIGFNYNTRDKIAHVNTSIVVLPT
jgi:hypothetical protein